MTNTVNIPTNMLPEDGRFGSGPSKIRPEQVQALDAGARNLLGTSHRQTPVKQVVGSIREGLSNFFQIPDGYEVVPTAALRVISDAQARSQNALAPPWPSTTS